MQALKSKHVNRYIIGVGDPDGDYQLDVDVSGLIFSHHPLFSREHVLGARLAQLYDQHLTRRHKNVTRLLTDKVRRSSSITMVTAFTVGNLLNNTQPLFPIVRFQLNGLRNAIHNTLELHNGEGLSLVSQQRIMEYKQEIR